MLTIAFIILKLTDVLLLSWWWIILAVFIDSARENRIRAAVSDLENRIEELEAKEEEEESDYDD